MAIPNPVKVGASIVAFGGLVAGTTIGIHDIASMSHSDTVQRILDWEKNNGGCRIHMVVSLHEGGVLYRVGESDRKGITDEHLEGLYDDLTTNNIKDARARQGECQKASGKDLVVSKRGKLGWRKDSPSLDNFWRSRVSDFAE